MSDVKWIKITTDIFDDEKILLIESLPDSYAIITVWFKLLCLAGKMNNSGVFMMSNSIAYTDTMLSTIFRMKESTVQLALNTFEKFGMIELVDGVITIPNWGKHQDLDKIEAKRDYMRNYMKDYREKQKQLSCKTNSKSNSKANVSEAEIDKNKKENKKENKYKGERVFYVSNPKLNAAIHDFIEMRKKIKKPMTDHAIDLFLKKLDKISGADDELAIKIIEESILKSWTDIYPLKDDFKPKQNNNKIDWDNV